MSEIKEGYYNGQILSAEIIRSRFAKDENDNRLEVALTCGVFDAQNNPMKDVRAEVYLELSSDFPKFGDTSKPYWEQTMAQLHELGFSGHDLTTLAEQMVNKPCRLNYRTHDKNGVAIKNPGWYLTRARERVVVKAADANALLQQMMGGGAAPAPAAAPSAAANPNPFN